MGILIDTSVLIDVERSKRKKAALSRLGEDAVYLAAITASELLHGVHRADSPARRAERQGFVEALLDMIPVLPFDLPVARIHSGLWAEMRQRGTPMGAHDLLIAATAIWHDLDLLTADARGFRRIDGLRLVS